MGWFFTECSKAGVRLGPCSSKVFLLSLEVAQLCVLESSSHVQELRPAGFSDSSAVPAAIPALGKGFSLKRGNSVLPEAGSKVRNSRALLIEAFLFFISVCA